VTAGANEELTAIDLFAGCGGLSLGIKRAGFRIVAAVEINPEASRTYRQNHRRTRLLERDIRQLADNELLDAAEGRKPDLIVGCAPCQGFCSLTRKWKREDPRNDLLLEMGRLIERMQPDAVMMENVPGLLTYGKETFRRFVRRLDDSGYLCGWRVVQMADFGLPQSRRRLVFLAGRGFMIPFPEPTHGALSPAGAPRVTVREALARQGRPVALAKAIKKGGPQLFNWHVVRDLHPRTKARLRAAKPGKTWLSLDKRLRPKCHRGGYEGFTNVYGRMTWDEIAPTITTGCTTPAKGRFGHPDRRRTTISVREAAILQGFPVTYRFATDHMESVCEMIGNAVPPHYARVLGAQIMEALRDHRNALAKRE